MHRLIQWLKVRREKAMVLEPSSVLTAETKNGTENTCQRISLMLGCAPHSPQTSRMLRCAPHAPQTSTHKTESSEQRCQINSSIARLQYCILALPNVTIWKKETKLIPMGLSVSFATWYTITAMKFSIKVNHTLLN